MKHNNLNGGFELLTSTIVLGLRCQIEFKHARTLALESRLWVMAIL